MNWNKLMRWAVAGVVIVAVLCLGRALWIAHRFRTEGVETMGIVTKVYMKTEYRTVRVTRRTSRQVKTTAWFLDYRFSVGDSVFVDSQRLGRTYSNIRKGDSIGIRYLPDNPARSRLAFDREGRHIVKRRSRRRR